MYCNRHNNLGRTQINSCSYNLHLKDTNLGSLQIITTDTVGKEKDSKKGVSVLVGFYGYDEELNDVNLT